MNLIIITFIAINFAAKDTCTSSFYKENYKKTNIKFFVPETYDITNPCELITPTQFRKLYPQYLKNNHVEHIIDHANSEQTLQHCNKDIRGNMILANADWNRQVGQLCWDNVKKEKIDVYGNIFRTALDAVTKCCSQIMPIISERHTNFYKNNQYGAKSIFYDHRTMGIDIFPNPCDSVSSKQFRQYVNSKIKCEGPLCKNSEYKCGHLGDKNCYHVVHIISKNGPEFPCDTDCKNIVANMVMINGNWNSGLGGLSNHYYQSVMKEKELVFGKDVVDRIRKQITECDNVALTIQDDDDSESYVDICDTNADCECDTDEICGCDCSDEFNLGQYVTYEILLWILLGISCLCVILIIITCITCGCMCKRTKTADIEYDHQL